jgi:hypothetical protein
VLQALEKTAVLEYEKMASKIDVMYDITHTSLPSKALVMCDVKCWSYLYSSSKSTPEATETHPLSVLKSSPVWFFASKRGNWQPQPV